MVLLRTWFGVRNGLFEPVVFEEADLEAAADGEVDGVGLALVGLPLGLDDVEDLVEVAEVGQEEALQVAVLHIGPISKKKKNANSILR